MENLYQVLEVTPSASAEQIRRAYKRLALQWHPDRHQGSPRHEERFKAITMAYQVLSNPERRLQYDYQRGRPAVAPPAYRPSEAAVPGHRPTYRRVHRRRPVVITDSPRQRLTMLVLLLAFVPLALGLDALMGYLSVPANQFAIAHHVFGRDGEYFFAKARQAQAVNKLAEARDYYEAAFAYARHIPAEWYYWRGNHRRAARAFAAARDDYQAALALEPRYQAAWLALAQVGAHHLQDIAAAQAAYSQLIALNPEESAAWLGRAYCHLRADNFAAALRDVSVVWHLVPTPPARAFYYRGIARFYLGEAGACQDWAEAAARGETAAKPLLGHYCP